MPGRKYAVLKTRENFPHYVELVTISRRVSENNDKIVSVACDPVGNGFIVVVKTDDIYKHDYSPFQVV